MEKSLGKLVCPWPECIFSQFAAISCFIFTFWFCFPWLDIFHIIHILPNCTFTIRISFSTGSETWAKIYLLKINLINILNHSPNENLVSVTWPLCHLGKWMPPKHQFLFSRGWERTWALLCDSYVVSSKFSTCSFGLLFNFRALCWMVTLRAIRSSCVYWCM